jgi:FlaG/FlaF family flagellin (archaellin)
MNWTAILAAGAISIGLILAAKAQTVTNGPYQISSSTMGQAWLVNTNNGETRFCQYPNSGIGANCIVVPFK